MQLYSGRDQPRDFRVCVSLCPGLFSLHSQSHTHTPVRMCFPEVPAPHQCSEGHFHHHLTPPYTQCHLYVCVCVCVHMCESMWVQYVHECVYMCTVYTHIHVHITLCQLLAQILCVHIPTLFTTSLFQQYDEQTNQRCQKEITRDMIATAAGKT